MFFKRKKTDNANSGDTFSSLPGDMFDSSEKLDEIEKTRRDIMLACLEAAREDLKKDPDPSPLFEDEEIEPAQTEDCVQTAVEEEPIAEQAPLTEEPPVEEVKPIQECETPVSIKSPPSPSHLRQKPASQTPLVEKILTQIVQEDIQRLRTKKTS